MIGNKIRIRTQTVAQSSEFLHIRKFLSRGTSRRYNDKIKNNCQATEVFGHPALVSPRPICFTIWNRVRTLCSKCFQRMKRTHLSMKSSQNQHENCDEKLNNVWFFDRLSLTNLYCPTFSWNLTESFIPVWSTQSKLLIAGPLQFQVT